tara:strand:+ start:5246 stop:6112 length:867 start_codon:yes stop_codon:yes gene_type:complete
MSDITIDRPVLIIDAYNMIHRCRFEWGGGLAAGEYSVVYNFMRTLRLLVEDFSPSLVYFPLDGKPAARLEIDSSYKANRRVETQSEEEAAYWESFRRQKGIIIDTVKNYLPLKTVFHKEYECDDLVLYLVKKILKTDGDANIVIVSSDTDFIQLLNSYPNNVKLWNPLSKKYRENTDYDYVAWKAMVGDRSDNIPGVKGIGKVTAEKILKEAGALEGRMENDSFKKSFNHSYSLIKLDDLDGLDDEIDISSREFLPSEVERSFADMGFKSLLKETYLTKFNDTFKILV